MLTECYLSIRASELLLSIAANKRSASVVSVFSTSTPARSRSPEVSLSLIDQSPIPTQVATEPARSTTPARHPHALQINLVSENAQVSEKVLENDEEDALQAARTSFEAREFYHVTHLLQNCRSAKAKFLRTYSQFIVSASNGS